MTLIELLVVLVIVMLLAAATIPRLRPEIERSRVREAARSIQLYLSSARNQAIASGRSCGVLIERLPADLGCSMSLVQVETPARYGGDSINSTAIVVPTQGPIKGYAYCNIILSPPPSVALYPGDQIQIGYQGFWITLATQNPTNATTGAISNPGNLIGYVDVTHGETPFWTAQTQTQTPPIPQPFEIVREPSKSAAAALQLPSPACIDLTWSGIDPVLPADTPTWDMPPPTTTPYPVMIMFSPRGSVDQVYRYVSATKSYSATRVNSAIYLLVGKRENVTDPPNQTNWQAAGTGVPQPPQKATDPMNNVYDLNCLWVAINASTGSTVVTDNNIVTLPANQPATSPVVLQQSRLFARESSAMGGK